MTKPRPYIAFKDPLPREGMAWLRGESGLAWQHLLTLRDGASLEDIWATYGERVVREHVEDHPGTRPIRWWQYSAPEARKFLGGVGTPLHQCSAYAPELERGIPKRWRRAGDFMGNTLIDKYPPIDPNNPPLFESEATYLARLNLLLPGERECLTPEDFEPEAMR